MPKAQPYFYDANAFQHIPLDVLERYMHGSDNLLISPIQALPFTHFRPRVSSDPGGRKDFEALETAPEDLDARHAVVLAS